MKVLVCDELENHNLTKLIQEENRKSKQSYSHL